MDTHEFLKEKLPGVIQGDVVFDDETLNKHSRDASIFMMRPKAVVFPKDVADVQALARFVSEHKKQYPDLSLTARAAGTDMSGGPLSESIVVSFTKYMNHVSVQGDRAVVEPGTYYRDFEKATLEYGLLMPSYPASKDLCALGGMISNNCGGELSLKYGKIDKYVESLDVVLADGSLITVKPLTPDELEEKKKLRTLEGDIYRRMADLIEANKSRIDSAEPQVTKNSAGYALWNVWDEERGVFDLTRLIVGSQGTLGLFTSATVRLVKPPKHHALLVIFMRDLGKIPDVVNKVLPLRPEAIESFDDQTLSLAIRFAPELIRQMKGGIISLALSFLPEVKMALFSGLPKLIMLVEFAGNNEAEVLKAAKEAERALHGLGLSLRVTNERESQKYWTIRRKSFDLLRKHYKGLRASAFIDDVVVRPEELPRFLPEMRAILDKYNIINTVAGHVGDGNFHIIPLIDFSKPDTPWMLRRLCDEMYALVKKYRGSITGEHNDGLIRTGYLPAMFDEEMIHIFEETEHIFDPQDIFNPGKKVHGSLDDAFKHVIKWEVKK